MAMNIGRGCNCLQELGNIPCVPSAKCGLSAAQITALIESAIEAFLNQGPSTEITFGGSAIGGTGPVTLQSFQTTSGTVIFFDMVIASDRETSDEVTVFNVKVAFKNRGGVVTMLPNQDRLMFSEIPNQNDISVTFTTGPGPGIINVVVDDIQPVLAEWSGRLLATIFPL
jgi:hypothetical protein